VVAGQFTAVPAIIVYLVSKRPPDQVNPRDLIPASIDGVPTDVIESAIPVAHAEDLERYTPLLGGVQTQGGDNYSVGTLGFIGALNEPDPRIVGVTNWHVAGLPSGAKTRLQANISADQLSIDFVSPTPQITPKGAYVRIYLRVRTDASTPERPLDFLAQASGADTVVELAATVAATISAFADPALTASSSGGTVSLHLVAGASVTQIGADVPHHNQFHQTYGIQGDSPNSRLRAKVDHDTITIGGVIDGEDYGIFTKLHPLRGFIPTVGVYVALTKEQPLASVASTLASALRGLGGGVTATATGTQVKVGPGFMIECVTWRDVRMGQPDNDFGCCCSHRIGRTVMAREDLDIALVQLDAGLEYLAEVHEIGPLTGQHVITDAEVMAGVTVRKRGRTTLLTQGRVTSIHRLGLIQDNVGNTSTFPFAFRRYTEAMTIVSTDASPFSDRGDSGSAIVLSTGARNDVVGVLFGGTTSGPAETVATNIGPIASTFDLLVKTATASGQVQTVPEVAAAVARAGGRRVAARERTASSVRMRQVQRDMSRTERGRGYVELVRRHFREVSRLVNRNRRVGAAWQRGGGPMLLSAVLQCVENPTFVFPAVVAGRPVGDCWASIRSALRARGSAELVAALDELDFSGSELGGKTYAEILDWLREREAEEQRSLSPSIEEQRSSGGRSVSVEEQRSPGGRSVSVEAQG
jgi:Trypsin